MPSFDTVLDPNLVEVKNAVENTAKEIVTRFDFKGTSAAVELKDKEITMFGDADFQLVQVEDVLRNKLTKREVDVRFLDKGDVQKVGGDKVKQVIKIRNGIETEVSKKIQRLLKDKPQALGLTVPGMPIGSPGMDGEVYGGRQDPYDVLLILKDGSTRVYQSYGRRA